MFQTRASASEPGHYRADRRISYSYNISIGQSFELAKYKCFPPFDRQLFQALENHCPIGIPDHQRLRTGTFRRGAVYFLIENGRQLLRSILLQPGIACIANNL